MSKRLLKEEVVLTVVHAVRTALLEKKISNLKLLIFFISIMSLLFFHVFLCIYLLSFYNISLL